LFLDCCGSRYWKFIEDFYPEKFKRVNTTSITMIDTQTAASTTAQKIVPSKKRKKKSLTKTSVAVLLDPVLRRKSYQSSAKTPEWNVADLPLEKERSQDFDVFDVPQYIEMPSESNIEKVDIIEIDSASSDDIIPNQELYWQKQNLRGP